MYDRVVDGQELILGTSGQIWRQNLVLYDQGTRTLWNQFLGVGERGPLKGKILRRLPALVTDWQTWQAGNPESTVVLLRPHSQVYVRDKAPPPALFVLGIADSEAMDWNLEDLSKAGAINDEWNGQPVVAVFDPGGQSARLYHRKVDGRVLTFAMTEKQLTDSETKSSWDAATGRATAGPLAGRSLSLLPAGLARQEAWFRFHPQSLPGKSRN